MYLTEAIMIASLIIAAMYIPLIIIKQKLTNFFSHKELHKRRIEGKNE